MQNFKFTPKRLGLTVLTACAILMLGALMWPGGSKAQSSQEKIVRSYGTMLQLIQKNPNDSSDNVVIVEGINSSADGLGAVFQFDPNSAAATNTTTIFKPVNYSGRWARMFGGSGTNAAQLKVLAGIQAGTSKSSADANGTVTNTFTAAFSSPPIVVVSAVSHTPGSNFVSVITTTNFIWTCGEPAITNNWVAIGAP